MCSGKCNIQQYQVRNLSIASVTKEPPDIECRDLNEQEVADLLQEAEGDGKKDAIIGCNPQENCFCHDIPGQMPRWTDWFPSFWGPKVLTIGPCTYSVMVRWERRSRIFEGLCMPALLRPKAASGYIPEADFMVASRRLNVISPDLLRKIRDIVTAAG